MRGHTGPRTAKRANGSRVTYCMYVASGERLSYTPSVECVVGSTIHETQPVHSENFAIF